MARKILIADDETFVQKLVPRALGAEAYEFLHAGDGREALALARSGAPDLVLLDVRMPRKSGWDVLAELRGDIRTRMIPVIMLTACGETADKVGGFELGADDYVTKPFEIKELKARIEGTLRRQELELGANPLTRLPGSPTIELEVQRRIREAAPFAFLYIDVDHFKPYNDVHGYAQGDRVIRETAELLVEAVRRRGGDGFAGHVGGDDFVAIVRPEEAQAAAEDLAALFDWRALSFHDARERREKGFEAQDRQGRTQRFPLLALSIGIVTTEHRVLDHYAKVVQIASEMKRYVKSRSPQGRSSFAFDRRRDR